MNSRPEKQHRILFICLGNICRSPMAEGLFRHLVEEAGRGDEFIIDSAGTSNWHIGEQPDSDGQASMRNRGLDISQQRCRQVSVDDFSEFDLLIAMDGQNRKDLVEQAKSNGLADEAAKVRLLLDYAPNAGTRYVPDPWSHGPGAFETSVDLIESGCIGLLAALPNLKG